MAQAILFRMDNARTNGALLSMDVVVCYSGPEVNSGFPDVRQITIDGIDPSLTTNQFQSALAAGIRAQATALGYSIPANGVTIPGFSKG